MLKITKDNIDEFFEIEVRLRDCHFMELHCGTLTMQYDGGFLRYIRAGDMEMLRMIYFAVRDENWGTLKGKIQNEKVTPYENGFTITYEMLFEQDEIKMLWTAVIDAQEDNILFEIKGKALSTFKKNRTGFCVLHPIKDCRGGGVVITHTDGSTEEDIFPYYISAHQPFKNIKAMQWRLAPDCNASIAFYGDVFETEDQRNWTDNSYKTYCTPLEIPFPATMHEGDEVHQKIILKVHWQATGRRRDETVKITISDELIKIPAIGVARTSERDKYYYEALKKLSTVGFSHYRVDIKLSCKNWKETLKEAVTESKIIRAPLEIALFVEEGMGDALTEFIQSVNTEPVKQIILLQAKARCISHDLLQRSLHEIKSALPEIPVGAGTDLYFTELNRSDLNATCTDFVSYSINPQVHAFDDASLIENLEAQQYTVETALHKYKKPVHVSPVTLNMRYNADATSQTNTQPVPADERQQTDFCAAWTLGSLKYLIESGAGSITYFEAAGKKGLMSGDERLMAFPVLEAFEMILNKRFTHLKRSFSSHPLECSSLMLCGEEECLVVINYTQTEMRVEVENVLPGALLVSPLEFICRKLVRHKAI